jgi:hypothetical protein
MTTDLIRYDLLVQDALRSVVRRVLGDAARDGLPGEHHFYVSFRTDRPGVRISPRLRERYPQDMTIVLQHQFDNLVVQDHAFEVGLSFSGVAERLRVPFEALTGFFDPSVQFGLKFEAQEGETEAPAAEGPVLVTGKSASSVPAIGPKTQDEEAPAKGKTSKKAKRAEDEASADAGGGEVVSLDAFRKKS